MHSRTAPLQSVTGKAISNIDQTGRKICIGHDKPILHSLIFQFFKLINLQIKII